MDRLRAFLRLNSLASAIIAGVLAIVLVIAAIMALGLGGGFLLALLIGIVIFFGSIRTLAGSVVIASLLKMFTAPISTLLGLLIPPGKLSVLIVTLTSLHWLDCVDGGVLLHLRPLLPDRLREVQPRDREVRGHQQDSFRRLLVGNPAPGTCLGLFHTLSTSNSCEKGQSIAYYE